MYEFIKVMWIMKRINEDGVKAYALRGFITQEQCSEILGMEQKQ
jgi:hypothetical protein